MTAAGAAFTPKLYMQTVCMVHMLSFCGPESAAAFFATSQQNNKCSLHPKAWHWLWAGLRCTELTDRINLLMWLRNASASVHDVAGEFLKWINYTCTVTLSQELASLFAAGSICAFYAKFFVQLGARLSKDLCHKIVDALLGGSFTIDVCRTSSIQQFNEEYGHNSYSDDDEDEDVFQAPQVIKYGDKDVLEYGRAETRITVSVCLEVPKRICKHMHKQSRLEGFRMTSQFVVDVDRGCFASRNEGAMINTIEGHGLVPGWSVPILSWDWENGDGCDQIYIAQQSAAEGGRGFDVHGAQGFFFTLDNLCPHPDILIQFGMCAGIISASPACHAYADGWGLDDVAKAVSCYCMASSSSSSSSFTHESSTFAPAQIPIITKFLKSCDLPRDT